MDVLHFLFLADTDKWELQIFLQEVRWFEQKSQLWRDSILLPLYFWQFCVSKTDSEKL